MISSNYSYFLLRFSRYRRGTSATPPPPPPPQVHSRNIEDNMAQGRILSEMAAWDGTCGTRWNFMGIKGTCQDGQMG